MRTATYCKKENCLYTSIHKNSLFLIGSKAEQKFQKKGGKGDLDNKWFIYWYDKIIKLGRGENDILNVAHSRVVFQKHETEIWSKGGQFRELIVYLLLLQSRK